MLSIYDRSSTAAALSLPLEPGLRALLASRIANLTAGEHDLTELTHILVIEDEIEAAIVEEIGLSPLVNPIDGARYPATEFHPWWDWLGHVDGHFLMLIAVGNSGFCYELIFVDREQNKNDLLTLCREHV